MVMADSRYKPGPPHDPETGRVINNWRVYWEREEELLYRDFLGDKPTKAVEFGKKLKLRGFHVEVVSTRHSFAPRGEAPGPGYLWCPYCLKWRVFEDIIRNTFIPTSTTADYCCPVCYISDHDAYVRRYNPEIVARREIALEMKAKMREVARNNKLERRTYGRKARRAKSR